MAAKVIATWQGIDNMDARIKAHDEQMQRVIAAQVQYASDNDAPIFAKKNAPWTDRTGNARSGLHSATNFGDGFAELIVSHSVPYGIWLEVRWSGKYAIIGTTVFVMGKLIIGRIDSTFKKMGASA